MHKVQWGCTKPVMQPHPYRNDPAISRCPLTYFRDHPDIEGVAFDLHIHWKRGILPSGGGIDDQAAIYRDVVIAVENGIVTGQARLRDLDKRKAEKEAKKPAAGNRKTGKRS